MPTATVKAKFAVHEVVALTRFTKYMLDYLARDEIFRPSVDRPGRGRRRYYSYEDVVLLRALYDVCKDRGKIRHLRAALTRFREDQGPIQPGQRLDAKLLVAGDELFLVEAADVVRRMRDGQLAFSFVVDMSVVTSDLARCVVIDPRSRTAKLTADMAAIAEGHRQDAWRKLQAKRRREAA